MYIKRDRYLDALISRQGNGQIKVITGVRCCGKSFLLFNIFCDYLKSTGIKDDQIISVALDDNLNEKYRDPEVLSAYVRSKIRNTKKTYYVLLDEVKYAISGIELKNRDAPARLYSVLNGLLRLGNVDVYVTGSNSKMLSRDVMTEFRGRGDIVEIYPLNFKEYYGYVGGNREEAFEDYALYGGMPLVLSKKSNEEKFRYLSDLFNEVYFRDIIERYGIELPNVLSELTSDLCSSVGSLTNAAKIANTLGSVRGIQVRSETIAAYLLYLTDAFLFKCARRYDVKGKKYFDYPSKYYCADIGLRNVRLNLRQQEETHIMENIIYNELVTRNCMVDVGVIKTEQKDEDGRRHQQSHEIDFVVNRGAKKYYIQSSLTMADKDKAERELRPLLAVNDFFKKIIITKTIMKPWTDDRGVVRLGLYDFLLNENSLDL
jgi:predicted AAA+ superfamily ATPase